MTTFQEQLLATLDRIATALEILALPESQEPPETTCPHPPEERIDFGMTNGQPDWTCKLCGYRSQ